MLTYRTRTSAFSLQPLAFLFLSALAAQAQDATGVQSPAPADSLTFTNIIAAIGAVVLAARAVVKLTPTPKDDTWVSTVIDWLKHIGLHLGCLLLICALATGCNTSGGTAGATYDSEGNVTANAGINITSNTSIVGTGTYNTGNGQWMAGISIVFRDAASAQAAAADLALYNIGPAPVTRDAQVWQIARFDKTNPYHLSVVECALKAGAVIRGL